MTDALRRAAERVAYEAGFLASDLQTYAQLEGVERGALSAGLSVSDGEFDELALCRTPRRGGGFRSDVVAIAGLVDADAVALASMVRLVDAVSALASAPTSKAAPMLAAAREVAERSVKADGPASGLRPTWVTEAVDLLWGDPAVGGFPRDMELALLWRLPLAIVELNRLSGVSVVDWLAARGIHLPVHVPPDELRGALVAFAGSGVLFLDADDEPAVRRLSAAHEGAHFAADYWLPRKKLAERAPQLLDVVDGVREPDPEDQIDALLARIPLGVHTHLFERDRRGGDRDLAVGRVEERAARIAWELLAPEDAVAERAAHSDEFSVLRILEAEFGLPRTAAREYASYLRARKGRGARRRFEW